jgi:hypothetical protein
MALTPGYLAWNRAVAQRYFSEQLCGRPTYLAADEDDLPGIADTAETGAQEPLEAFCRAVQDSLGDPPNLFKPWLDELGSWRASNEIPPYLALLAVCVIAASRMAADPERGIAANDYYKRLNPLLGRDEGGRIPPGFEGVRDLWADLELWLDDDLEGSHGTSAVHEHRWFVHIGYPLSQCALRTADRHRLPDFFRSAKLHAGDEIADERLLVLLRAWATRPSSGLTAFGRRAIAADDSHRTKAVTAIVQHELRQWDGQLRDQKGRRRSEAVMVLTTRRGRVTEARLFAPRPEGFPSAGDWTGAAGAFHLEVAAEGWYSEISPFSAIDVLTRGIQLANGAFSITWQPTPLIVFARAFLPESGWVSQRQAHLREEVLVLADGSLGSAIKALLDEHADPRYSRAPAPSMFPSGWQLYSGVKIKSVEQGPVPPGLEPLVPRLNTAATIEGGLRLAPGVYLAGHEPDLHVSIEEGEPGQVAVDGMPQKFLPGTLTIPLSRSGLPEGEHEIRAGGRTIRFSTTRTFGLVAPDQAGELAQVLERHNVYQPRSLYATDGTGGPAAPGTVEVCGADVDAHNDDLPVPVRPPVVLRHGFTRYEILGPVPGHVQLSREPDKPTWLPADSFLCFEVDAPFAPGLVIQKGRLRPVVRPLETSVPPPEEESDAAPADVMAWAAAVLDAFEANAVVPNDLWPTWELYVERAWALVSEAEHA